MPRHAPRAFDPVTPLPLLTRTCLAGTSPQPHLVYVAELALCLELPAGWELVRGEKGATNMYRHAVSNVTSARHPLAAYASSLSCV